MNKIPEQEHNENIDKEHFDENKRLAVTLDSIGDGVITTDICGNIIMLNKTAMAFTGWSHSEAYGKPLHEIFKIIDKTTGEPLEDLFKKVMRDKVATGLKKDTILISKDGIERFISANVAPIRYSQDKIMGVVVVFRDITRIKLIENELINEQRKLSIIFDAIPVGMLLLDEEKIVKMVNTSLTEMLGRGQSKLINRKMGEALGCINSHNSQDGCGNSENCKFCKLSTELEKIFHSGEVIRGMEIYYPIQNKACAVGLWLRINSVPIIIEGTKHVIVAIDDITKNKRIEEELEHSNRELEAAIVKLKNTQSQLIQQEKMAGIGQLAAGIAHEINNPLGFIMSNFETFKRYIEKYKELISIYRKFKGRLMDIENIDIKSSIMYINDLEKKNNIDFITADFEDLFSDTFDGLERIKKIVTELRVFSHIDQQDDFIKYDLNAGIKSTLVVAHNEIKYVAEVKENLGNIPEIDANGGQINQVLLNIIINAVQAIKSKETKELGLIKISTYEHLGFVYCEIEDNGIGISQKDMEKIFNPFFTTKPVGRATGLGLSISYEIVVNRHNGELNVESKPGIGTKFIIKLPINNNFNKHD